MKQKKVHKGGESITALLFPRHCPVCDRLLADDEPYLCRRCASELVFVREPVCMKCGRPLDRESAELCDACRRREHRFIRGFAPFLYRGAVQASVLRFKYGGRAEYAGFYARAICTFGKEKLALWKPACVIPVPVHPLRYCTRGYNQAAVTAVEIARVTGVAVLVKGGHGENDANDVLARPDGTVTWFEGERVDTANTHGTGCTLSSAIACGLAVGKPLEEAVKSAKDYITGALSAGLDLGHGSGPMDHMWAY